jgi:hypothetical protein
MEELKAWWDIVREGGVSGVLFLSVLMLYYKLDKQEKRTDAKDEKIYNLIAWIEKMNTLQEETNRSLQQLTTILIQGVSCKK